MEHVPEHVPYPAKGLIQLRDYLEYGRDKKNRETCLAFTKTIRSYIATYRTRKGIAGSGLHNWKDNYWELIEMADDFLERDGHGDLYWPDDDTSPNFGKLRFSKDTDIIRLTMTQILFKTISQAWSHRNKKKATADQIPQQQQRRRRRRTKVGAEVEPPVGIDNLPNSSSSRPNHQAEPRSPVADAAQIDGLSSPPPSAGTEDEFREFIDSNLNINESEVQDQGIDHSRMPLRDPYDGPSSPEIPTPEIPTSRTRKRTFSLTPEPELPQAKYARHQGPIPTNAISSSASDTGGPRSPQFDNYPSFSSLSREQNQRVYPDFTPFGNLSESGHEVVDSVESDFPHSHSIRPQAPMARMERQDTVGTIGRDAEPSSLELPREDTPRSNEPQFVVPPLPARRPIVPAQFSRDMRAASEPQKQQPLHPASFHQPQQERAPLSKEISASISTFESTPTYRSSPAGRSDTSDGTPTTRRSSSGALPDYEITFSVEVFPTQFSRWRPKGTFLAKTLKGLVEEMRNDFDMAPNFTGLSLLLETPRGNFDDQVNLTDERGFDDIKRRFSRKIKAALQSLRSSTDVKDFEIVISPLRNDGQSSDVNGAEDLSY